MRGRVVAIVLVTMLVSVAVPVGADPAGDAEGPRAIILQDGPPDGETYVGQLNTFGWLLLDEDGEPWVHHDAVFTVKLNGETLLETTGSSGHDYDGIDPYQVVFPEPGTYEVAVEVPLGNGETAEANLSGKVMPAPADAAEPEVHLKAPDEAAVGETVTLSYGLHAAGHDEEAHDGHEGMHGKEAMDGEGAHLSHTDAVVSIREADTNFEVFRTHTHGHHGMQSLDYVFQAPGTYEVRVTGYSDNPKGPKIPATVASAEVEVTGEQAPPMVPTTMRENVVHSGEAPGDWSIYATYDPYTVTGPFGRMRLGAVLVDGDGAPVAHSNFTAKIEGPSGQVLFESTDLHEHDGVLEVITNHPRTGDYTMTVTADHAGKEAKVTHRYAVYPPAAPTGAGPQFTMVDGLDGLKAGESGTVTVSVQGAGGVPFIHSEVDYRVLDAETKTPVLAGKLHTHNSGEFPLKLTLPEAGDYVLDLSPTALEATATPRYYGPEVGTTPTFDLTVAEGPGLPTGDVGPADDAGPAGATTPGFGMVAAVAAVGAAVVLFGRRG